MLRCIFTHPCYLLLKANRAKFREWLEAKSDEERRILFQRAMREGVKLRKKHREFENQTDEAIESIFQMECEKKRRRKEKAPKRARPAPTHDETGSSDDHDDDTELEEVDDEPLLPDGSECAVGDWVAVAFDNGWYPGEFLCYQSNHADISIVVFSRCKLYIKL